MTQSNNPNKPPRTVQRATNNPAALARLIMRVYPVIDGHLSIRGLFADIPRSLIGVPVCEGTIAHIRTQLTHYQIVGSKA